MAAQIITIAIEKGGAGKTVTASNLAYLMGDEGKKVLCIDTLQAEFIMAKRSLICLTDFDTLGQETILLKPNMRTLI